jgi:hypothetical protein
MKKLLLSLLVVVGISLKAQDASKVFTATEVVWYGLDFTKAKFIGAFDQGMGIAGATGTDMRNKWVPKWNDLIIKEQDKYSVKDAFRKESIYYDIAAVNALNSKIDVDNMMSPNPTKIDKSEIPNMVKNYSGDKKEGLGVAFIIESFNKNDKVADLYVVCFDIATKKVLICEKMSGTPAGGGMRNYWAGAIKDVLNQIDGGVYKRWKKEAGVK